MIFNFERKRISVVYARKVNREIRAVARKLELLPESLPRLSGSEGEKQTIRYVKAFSYKIIFYVFKKEKKVVVITIRNDAEDPKDVMGDL